MALHLQGRTPREIAAKMGVTPKGRYVPPRGRFRPPIAVRDTYTTPDLGPSIPIGGYDEHGRVKTGAIFDLGRQTAVGGWAADRREASRVIAVMDDGSEIDDTDALL